MKAEFLNVPELAQCCSLADIVPPFQVCLTFDKQSITERRP